MNYYEIKKLINSGVNIRDIPLRVTYYARVSTDNSLQLNSLDNQINYYENLIKNNQKWIFHPGYIDEGISGSSVKNRHNFLRMIRDAKLGLFDLIITKEVSRFSRSLLDSIKYTQELNRYNVGIFFETNGINTFDSNSEFLLNMMGSVAQEEVKRLSSRIKWGQINAIKQGHILGSKITGFYKEKNKLIINPNETKLIKTIFSLYASGKYGLTTLSIKLASLGYLNSKGNLYDKNTLKGIITNPKYKGYYCGHKTEIIDYKTKKRINVASENQIIYATNNIPKIVSESEWNKANEILKSRAKKNNNIRQILTYSGLIKCHEHHTSFIRSKGSKRSTQIKWVCKNYLLYNLHGCVSPIISENDLNQIIFLIIKSIKIDEEKIINDLKKYYQKSINKFDITEIRKRQNKLIEMFLNNLITENNYQTINTKYNNEILKINNFEKEINNVINYIKNKTYQNNISDFVHLFIDNILVEKLDNCRNNIHLIISLKHLKLTHEFYFKSLDKNARIKNNFFITVCSI